MIKGKNQQVHFTVEETKDNRKTVISLEAINEIRKIKADKERGDNDLEKTIDVLETQITIKDYEIQTLKEKLKKN